MTGSDAAGSLIFHREGFEVLWDKHGLKIITLDYEVEGLHLSWESILDLAQRAGVGISCQASLKNEKGII